jgi:DNA-binding response OmpR family regulator
MKILITEDEIDIANFLKKGLEENGHETMIAYDGKMALKLAMDIDFDLILLDVILPQMNGLEVCQRLRDDLDFKKSIIMLTALGTTDDVVSGLNNGADDYLTKPVKFRELLARVEAVQRRVDNSSQRSKKLEAGDLSLDLDKKEVIRNNQEISLTAKEFNLLTYLLKNKGRVMSRIDILENVWEVNFDLGTNVIDVYINYLRNKIDKGFDYKLLHTVVGMGYVIKDPQ